MKKNLQAYIGGLTLLTALAMPVRLAAQGNTAQANKPAQHHHYQLIDLGTFGGPTSYFSNGFDGILNPQGTNAGWADTSTPDPYYPNCLNPDCFVSHAFQWQKGTTIDLGVLPGGQSSSAAWISNTGLIAGLSQNGLIDPLLPGIPEVRAVLWRNRQIIDLGTLGGNESSASSVNNRGQVVGLATNNIPDRFSFLVTQLRAFLWQDGAIQDLGTLGTGNDAAASFVNEAGQVS